MLITIITSNMMIDTFYIIQGVINAAFLYMLCHIFIDVKSKQKEIEVMQMDIVMLHNRLQLCEKEITGIRHDFEDYLHFGG